MVLLHGRIGNPSYKSKKQREFRNSRCFRSIFTLAGKLRSCSPGCCRLAAEVGRTLRDLAAAERACRFESRSFVGFRSVGCFVDRIGLFRFDRGGFIHVPWSDEQAAERPGQPGLPMATMVEGIRIALETALAHARDIAIPAGAEH